MRFAADRREGPTDAGLPVSTRPLGWDFPLRVMGLVVLLLGALAATVSCTAETVAAIPEPSLTRIDYARPEAYTQIPSSLARVSTIERIAGEISGDDAREKLRAIGVWIDANMTYDASTFDRWRDVDTLVDEGTYGGCADHAELFGAIARGCGIPAVWVKTLDLDWIAWFRAHPDEPRSWSGHVFLEVHIEGAWRLYDASEGVLYETYDLRQRILPGQRLAYDKGDDPYELLLSTRWEDWKKQTRRFVETLDMALVPVARPEREDGGLPIEDPPGRVYVAASHPAWQWTVDRCNALGLSMGSLSGNGGWERWLPSARHGTLIVPVAGGRTVLPEAHWHLLPVQPSDMTTTLGDRASAVIRRTAADGTSVVLVLARDQAALRTAIAGLTTEDSKPASAIDPAEASPPGGRGKRVFVAANSPECHWIAKRCKALGYTVGTTGNAAFERWLPDARTGILIVVSLAGETVLTDEHKGLLPADAEAVRSRLERSESSRIRKTADDGTDVVLLMARDTDSLRAAVDALRLD